MKSSFCGFFIFKFCWRIKNKMKTNVLGINFDVIDGDSVIKKIFDVIENKEGKCFIVTANPEIVMLAQKDLELNKIINKADLVLPDGIGIVLASKLNKIKINKRITGYDLVQKIFSMSKDKNFSVYFLGGEENIVTKAKKNMGYKFDSLKIVGINNGFFSDEIKVVRKINLLKPDILLIGMGAPKQEKFIFKYKEIINAKIFIGVGGSFDVMAGKVKRAPKIFIDLNLEWLYRFMQEPRRFFRLMALPKFLFKVMLKKFFK